MKPSLPAELAPPLKDALNAAGEDDVLRVVMVLAEEGAPSSSGLRPSDFPNRTAFREALIDAQRNRVTAGTRNVREQLSKLGLTVRGGSTSRTVVVEGRAGDIVRALASVGIEHVTLDRKVSLARPGARGN